MNQTQSPAPSHIAYFELTLVEPHFSQTSTDPLTHGQRPPLRDDRRRSIRTTNAIAQLIAGK